MSLSSILYTCEKCGEPVYIPYGSGRFCSRKCANSRQHSDKTKKKIRETLVLSSKYVDKRTLQIAEYEKQHKCCVVCGASIPYEKRDRVTCSNECANKLRSIRAYANPHPGGLRHGSGRGKKGTYNGFYCDSSYELAFIIYHLDHNVPITRNTRYYLYVNSENRICKYFPDFIVNGELVELKGFINKDVYLKISSVDDMPIRLLMYEDIKHMIEYVKCKYRVNDITKLYNTH